MKNSWVRLISNKYGDQTDDDEASIVMSILRKASYGKNPKKAEAARKVLDSTRLFNEYVDIRIERRNEAQRIKEGRFTVWERIAKKFSREA